MKGSSTVEAALILPPVLVCLMTVMFLSLNFHDRLLILGMVRSQLGQLIRQEAEAVNEEGQLSEEKLFSEEWIPEDYDGAAVRLRERINGHLLSGRLESLQIERDGQMLRISWSGSAVFFSGRWFRGLLEESTSYSGTVTAEEAGSPEKIVRLLHGLVWRRENGNRDRG